MVPQGLFYAGEPGGSDAPVHLSRLLQVAGSFAAVVVVEVAVADTFQGACPLQRRAYIAAEGQRPAVVVAGTLRAPTPMHSTDSTACRPPSLRRRARHYRRGTTRTQVRTPLISRRYVPPLHELA